MSTKYAFLLAIVAVCLSLISCGQPATEEAPAEPEPVAEETGPDPAAIDPDHYRVDFENDRVRVVRITYGPGEESAMHYHPDSAAVFLTDHRVQMMLPDGSTSEMNAAAGTAVFAPGGQHQPRNMAADPLEVVQVELKGGPSGAGSPDGDDPTAVDGRHYTTEVENERVRLLRIKYGAGEESIMHYHPDSVAIFLTDHAVQMTMPDGSTSELTAAAGEAMFVPAGQHLPKNISDGPWELVLVELK
jgi:quercetin dioxygenase-like cupin family protein